MDESNQTELILLMQQAKKGDKDAFNELYGRFFVPVYRYIYKRVGNKQDAEDLVQNVFVKVYTSKSEYADTGVSPLNYFFIVARNILTDHWKKQRPDVSLEGRESETTYGILGGEASDPVNRAQRTEADMSVHQGLEQLAGEQKQVITMKFLEGYKTSEIASRLGKSPEAVRQIQSRGLRKIRGMMVS